MKLRNTHNFYLRVPGNRAVTAIWKKPMIIFSDAFRMMRYHLVGRFYFGNLWNSENSMEVTLGFSTSNIGSTSHKISDCSGGLSKRWFGGTAGGILKI